MDMEIDATEAGPSGMTAASNVREVPTGAGSEADQRQSVDDGGIEVLETPKPTKTQRLEEDKNKKSSKDDKVHLDKCDCLIPACPGCHYPCKDCGSRTCGHICKKDRDWQYVEVEVQGRDIIRKPLRN